MRLAMRVVGIPIFGTIATLLAFWGVVLIRRAFGGGADTGPFAMAVIGLGILLQAGLFGTTALALLVDASARLWRVVVTGAVAACVVVVLLAEAMGSVVLVGLVLLGALVVLALVQMRDPRG